ncbi:unnamed protein product [Acanthoscelides obtectus]|uniref:RING-type domain-containing protein n=1 Tax=Acanthoscelides obtectus TaxID=200917 RepID=A0A9P0PSF3_ACAOB|nr:unnamed protein product [Acanthoscelides obtectus]CAK1682263.1 Probable E3 ubiquitin-protein ligase RNF144A [Acanthoscelides obtectus]
MCNVPIEKDEGCAQMMCKRCKHVFCWYCLASLDDDFLLRHYDRSPCKNKLGHSRASVLFFAAPVVSCAVYRMQLVSTLQRGRLLFAAQRGRRQRGGGAEKFDGRSA